MMGILTTTTPKARREMSFKLWFRAANFSFSCSSRTKDFTTRMPARFSCTTRFSASVFSWRERNMGPTRVKITATAISSSGMATRNTPLSRRLMRMDSTRADTSITGARTSSRIPIISVICMALTSLVSRVTREAVEKPSMLEKAKV